MERASKVAIIGMGIITSQGTGVEEALSKKSRIPAFRVSEKNSRIGYCNIEEIDTHTYLPGINLRCTDRITIFTGIASSMATENYISPYTVCQYQIGMVLGTSFGSLASMSSFDLQALAEGPIAVNPMEFPNTVSNTPASKVGIWFTLTGPSVTISNGLTSGLDAIGYAFDEISYGKPFYYLVGGAEELFENIYKGYASVASSKMPPPSGDSVVEVIGEGAAVVFLSSMEEAINNQYEVYAEIIDFYSSKVTVDISYTDTIKNLISYLIEKNDLQGEAVSLYTSYLPFNIFSREVCKKLFKDYGDNRLVILNKAEDKYINYLGFNGAINLIYTVADLMNENAEAALVFDIGCDGKFSCIVLKSSQSSVYIRSK